MREDIDLVVFRQLLEERLATLTAGAGDGDRPVELDQTRVGRLSRMDAMQQQAMSQAARRLVNQEKVRIKTALTRLEEGEYGYCVHCGDDIPEGRLRFDPSVPSCIECAREAENR